MGERRGHPTAGWVVFAVTVALAGALVALLPLGLAGLAVCSMLSGGQCVGGASLVVLAAVSVALVVGGFWWAWRVGTGGWGRRQGWWPTHQIPAGGAEAWVSWKGWKHGSGERVDLPEWMPVRLREYRGVWAKVTAEDGRGGWVDADRLQPTGEGEGGGDG